MMLANEIASRPLELINGDLGDEIFQLYIISAPEFLLKYTNEIVFYDDELNLYVWGIIHFGTAGAMNQHLNFTRHKIAAPSYGNRHSLVICGIVLLQPA